MSQAIKHQRVHKANVRASETPVQTMNRQEQNKARMASMRASETPEQTALPRVSTLVPSLNLSLLRKVLERFRHFGTFRLFRYTRKRTMVVAGRSHRQTDIIMEKCSQLLTKVGSLPLANYSECCYSDAVVANLAI